MKTFALFALAFLIASGALFTSCNSTGSNTPGNDTTVGGKLKDAANDLGQAADKAATNIKQAAGNTASSLKEAIAGSPDSSFVVSATTSNNEELRLLEAGVNNGTDATLKANARQMLADHKTLAGKIAAFAAAKGYKLPAGDKNLANDHLDKISGKSGKDWDRSWTDVMVNDHQNDIRDFENASGNVKDASLKELIMNTLPTLRNHLVMMQNLQDKLKQ